MCNVSAVSPSMWHHFVLWRPQLLWENKHCGTKHFLKQFLSKHWSLSGLKRIQKKVDEECERDSVCVRRVGSKCVDGSWRHSSAVPLVSRYNWLPWAGDGHLPRKRHHAKMLSKESTANCVAMQPARFSHSSQWHLWITDSRTYWRYMVWLSACLSLHSHWGIAWTWQPAHLKRLNQIIICARMVKYLMWNITFLEFLSIFLLDLPASLMKNGQKMRYGSRWNCFGGKNTKS